MQDAVNSFYTRSSLAGPASPRDGTTRAAPTARMTSGLLHWLNPAHILSRSPADPAPLDEHTLSDIGLSRMDMLYSDSKK